MKQQWQESSENFLKLTIREQYLILLTGLVAIFFILFYLFIDDKMASNTNASKKIVQLSSSNQSLKISVLELQAALQGDPNEDTRNKIVQYEKKLANIDTKLLTLASDLMSPIQMRYALLDLLKLEKGVSLLSFELLGAKPLLSDPAPNLSSNSVSNTSVDTINSNENIASLNLYRHGIKIKLSGRYFDLRNYLTQLEKMPWKFFWQDFNFKLTEYPKSELEIEMYSLGTQKEFIGV
jgi:MSHA biogenesis protein MshJ